MASHHIALGDDSLSMSAAVADKLIGRGQGDAALLYLYLLRHRGYLDPEQATRQLHWSRLQLDSAGGAGAGLLRRRRQSGAGGCFLCLSRAAVRGGDRLGQAAVSVGHPHFTGDF